MAVQPTVKFRQFCDIKDAAHQGKKKGDTFHWDVYSDLATQGSTLVETNTMPETTFMVTQGTMTITEGGKLLAPLLSSFMDKFCSVIVGFNMAFAA